MAFRSTHQRANMGFGICGFANTVDNVVSHQHATVPTNYDEDGYIYDYETPAVNTHVGGEDDPSF